jgi:hypothetical protein
MVEGSDCRKKTTKETKDEEKERGQKMKARKLSDEKLKRRIRRKIK